MLEIVIDTSRPKMDSGGCRAVASALEQLVARLNKGHMTLTGELKDASGERIGGWRFIPD